jgi:hypothetical protein
MVWPEAGELRAGRRVRAGAAAGLARGGFLVAFRAGFFGTFLLAGLGGFFATGNLDDQHSDASPSPCHTIDRDDTPCLPASSPGGRTTVARPFRAWMATLSVPARRADDEVSSMRYLRRTFVGPAGPRNRYGCSRG